MKKTLFILLTFLVVLVVSPLKLELVDNTKKEVKGESFYNDSVYESSYVISTYPSSNYHASDYVRVGYSFGSTTWAYLKFGVNRIPADATITAAVLMLAPTSCSGSPSPETLTVGRVDSGWNQNTITWNNRPPSSNYVTSSNITCNQSQFSTDVTSIVNTWRSGAPNYGLVIYGPKNNSWQRTITEDTHMLLKLYYTTTDDPPPAPPVQAPPPSNPPAADNPSSGDSSTTPASPSKPASEAAAPVDASIQSPVLTTVKKNGKEIKTTPKERVGSLEIKQSDSLELVGTSFANAKVVIFIGDVAFETTANTEGKWSTVTDNSKLKTGEYSVQAQAQRDGKGSEKVTFFKLKVAEVKVAQTKEQKQSNARTNLFVALGIVLILFLIGVLINIRHHYLLKIKKSISKNKETKKGNSDK